MKNSFCNHRVFLSLIFNLIVSAAFSQKESFDLISFTPPAGWNKTPNGDVLMFSAPDKSDGSFCLISIYKSTPGTGNVNTDFSNAWNEVGVNRLKISAAPQMENVTAEGSWSNISGSASFKLDTIPSVAVLMTMSDNARTMSILIITNSQSYTAELDSFFSGIEIANNAAPEIAKSQQVQNTSVSGSLSDYIFDVPAGWTKEVTSGEIVLRGNDNISVISILPMQASTGDIEKDMASVFRQVFPGWEPDKWNPDNHISTKGVSSAGWNYYKDETAIAKTEGEKIFKTYAFVFLAQLGSNVAVIAGSYSRKMALLDEEANSDWLLFFHSLNFKNYPAGTISTLQKDILGEWLTGSGSGVLTYTFAANGRFSTGSAFSTSRDISQYKVLETTTSFVGDGKYIINGDEVTRTFEKTNKTIVEKVRVFYRKQYGDWQKKIGILDTSPAEGKPYEVTLTYVNQ